MRPSPLQNRVAPDGSLHAVPERGMFMGNRGGRLHRPDGTLGRARWRSRAWICCLTEFRGRHRQVLGEGYTELFFLDEATALAAGHRPCFECRRADARAFAEAWGRAQAAAAARRRDGPGAARRAPRAARAPSASARCPTGAIFAGGGRLPPAGPTGACAGVSPATAPRPVSRADETVAAITPAQRPRRAARRLPAAAPPERAAQLSAR